MDQATLVNFQIRGGSRLIDRLSNEGIAVPLAFWAKESESGLWYLYLATSLVGEDGATRKAYRRLNEVIRASRPDAFGIDPLEIKLIGPNDPIAQSVAAILDRQSRIGPAWFRDGRFGHVSVSEAYIYPPRGVFVFVYRRRGQSTLWDFSSQFKRCEPHERWTDGQVRFEQQGNTVQITVYSAEALEEGDDVPAEELARKEFEKRFPGQDLP